ncbi:MAG: carbamoyl phosphate synthase [Planctomycetota bacterium]|nr:ATP-grasp domain-containing protein [Rhodocyclaceae bacterium]MCZ2116058.1 ATP-grasp domain-containing protein [Anaerolineae bacterium]GIK54233.1 MAG: carbamoyl phosphate synthase [Planctomycetota bacterium]
MKTILITGIGGDIAQSVAGIIAANRPGYRLVGIDVHEQHAGAMYVNKFHVVPPAHAADYWTRLAEVMADENVDLVIPMTEPELSALLQLPSWPTDGRWITCGHDAVAAGVDKLETSRRLAQLGLAVPWTIPVAEGLPRALPCIFKNRFGSGSRGVSIVRVEEAAQYLAQRYPDGIFQELLLPDEKEITCAVYRTKDGRIAVLQLLRRLVGGFTGWAKVIDVPDVARTCRIIAEGLSLEGSMNVQLRLTDSGPRVFEINPRFSSTALMRQKMGFTDVLWAVDEAEGKPAELTEVAPGTIALRTQNAVIIPNHP